MRSIGAPAIATWLLTHFLPGENREVLVGDLIEEFHNGRSTAWFWRQTLFAITVGILRNASAHWTVLLFAALWSVLSPAWNLYAMQFERHAVLIGKMWLLAWPLSMICEFLLQNFIYLAFVWAGALLYLIPYTMIRGSLNFRGLARAFLLSGPVLLATVVATIALGQFIPYTHAIDLRVITPVASISDFCFVAVLGRIPFFFTTLCMVWGATSQSTRQPKSRA